MRNATKPPAMSSLVLTRSSTRSMKNALATTSTPAGRNPSAISIGDHPREFCRYSVTTNWKAT